MRITELTLHIVNGGYARRASWPIGVHVANVQKNVFCIGELGDSTHFAPAAISADDWIADDWEVFKSNGVSPFDYFK